MCSLYSLSLICLLCLCSSLAIAEDVLRRQSRQSSDDDVMIIDSTTGSKEGFITSPNFPSTSTSKEETTRVYKFLGRPDERVQIIFNEFDLYKLLPNEKCGWRNSLVSFERDLEDPVYLCGPRSLPLLSEKSEFILKYEAPRNFRTNEAFRGFNASYKFITNFGVNSGKQIKTGQCHFDYDSKDAKEGTFNSPNFPGLYPRNTDCTYTFHGEEKMNLTLEFTKFSLLGSNKNCSSALVDVLELTDTTKNYTFFFDQKRCGKQEPFSINVTASSFTVTLIRSTKRLNDSVFNEPRAFIGFEANYTFTSGGLSNMSSGSSLHLLITVLCLITSSCLGLRFI